MSVELLFPIAIGVLLGYLSGLGVGGGSLLILWLTVVQQMELPLARSINLMFFLPPAFLASVLRYRQGKWDWRILLPAAAAGCVCAGLGSWLSQRIDPSLLKKLFGLLLLAAGGRELFYRPKKPR